MQFDVLAKRLQLQIIQKNIEKNDEQEIPMIRVDQKRKFYELQILLQWLELNKNPLDEISKNMESIPLNKRKRNLQNYHKNEPSIKKISISKNSLNNLFEIILLLQENNKLQREFLEKQKQENFLFRQINLYLEIHVKNMTSKHLRKLQS